MVDLSTDRDPGAKLPTGITIPHRAAAFLGRELGLWVDGSWRPASDGSALEVVNPATGLPFTTVGAASPADVDVAVRSASSAFARGEWSRAPSREREEVMRRLATLIEEHGEELAVLDCLDNGMPLAQSRGEVTGAAAHLRYFAGCCSKLAGQTIPTYNGGPFSVFTRREPVGVVGAITAWNFPLDNAVWKIGAALACGNSVVLKPAEETPLSALYLGALATEAGLPFGVLNVVTGSGEEAGNALSTHDAVDKIAFTGSTATGREIVRASAGNLKRVTLELGGKSPSIVMADADLDRYLADIVTAVMYNTGQVCSAGSRVYVHRSLAADFVLEASAFAGSLSVGPGWLPGTDLGPLVSKAQLDRVLGYIADGQQHGAHLAFGGSRCEGELSGGYFVQPTIFDAVHDEMQIARDEIFGPVMSVLVFDGIDELVARANASTYGLAAGVWTRDVTIAHRLAEELAVGTVWVNCYNRFDPAVPFGGYRQSGYGRELGEAALDEYTQRKSVWIGLG